VIVVGGTVGYVVVSAWGKEKQAGEEEEEEEEEEKEEEEERKLELDRQFTCPRMPSLTYPSFYSFPSLPLPTILETRHVEETPVGTQSESLRRLAFAYSCCDARTKYDRFEWRAVRSNFDDENVRGPSTDEGWQGTDGKGA
jgi:hypothetical protein